MLIFIVFKAQVRKNGTSVPVGNKGKISIIRNYGEIKV